MSWAYSNWKEILSEGDITQQFSLSNSYGRVIFSFIKIEIKATGENMCEANIGWN